MSDGPLSLAVVVCTRNRGRQLHHTLDALTYLDGPRLPIVIVDQSDQPDELLVQRALHDHNVTVVQDCATGISRARNLAWRSLEQEWIVFVDDDCLPEPDWGVALERFVSGHPDADFVSGHVGASPGADNDSLLVSTFPVEREVRREGRWTPPWEIGFGVCMAVRRSVLVHHGGWDERLGIGSAGFPAADDMDFNYRLLRDGGVAYATPLVRAVHDQWRTDADLPRLFHAYLEGWSGFACKTLRGGDIRGGLWLWSTGVRDVVRLFASAGRRHSRLRLRVAIAKLAGLTEGTARGLLWHW